MHRKTIVSLILPSEIESNVQLLLHSLGECGIRYDGVDGWLGSELAAKIRMTIISPLKHWRRNDHVTHESKLDVSMALAYGLYDQQDQRPLRSPTT